MSLQQGDMPEPDDGIRRSTHIFFSYASEFASALVFGRGLGSLILFQLPQAKQNLRAKSKRYSISKVESSQPFWCVRGEGSRRVSHLSNLKPRAAERIS